MTDGGVQGLMQSLPESPQKFHLDLAGTEVSEKLLKCKSSDKLHRKAIDKPWGKCEVKRVFYFTFPPPASTP